MSKSARECARADRLKFREALRAELAKPEPDLAAGGAHCGRRAGA